MVSDERAGRKHGESVPYGRVRARPYTVSPLPAGAGYRLVTAVVSRAWAVAA
ncbi:hypothetical protein GCM10010341_23990 [Streptomyces noursei]|nr:hypothetical protein GCM10010341_23990 [Streptomyces noursei]